MITFISKLEKLHYHYEQIEILRNFAMRLSEHIQMQIKTKFTVQLRISTARRHIEWEY